MHPDNRIYDQGFDAGVESKRAEIKRLKEELADAKRTMDDLSEMVCDHAETDTEKLTESLREAITVEVKDAKAANPDLIRVLESIEIQAKHGKLFKDSGCFQDIIEDARRAITEATQIVEGG